MEAHYRKKIGVAARSKRFKDVAKLTIERMETALEAGEGKKTYTDYIQATNKYLIPYFGNRHLDTIDYKALKEFGTWRVEQMGKEPKGSTLANHNSALNRIFDEGLIHGYIVQSQIPVLENKGEASERRPDFTLEEWQKICRGLHEFVNEGRQGKSREMRLLLRDYVFILFNTGMRHGTEAQNLRWKHISLVGKDQVAMWVKGKTKARELITKSNCATYLQRIHKRCEDINHLSFEELLKSKCDLPVFRLSDGTVTDNLRQTFKVFLEEMGLLVDSRTNQERTLYSLRHTYATFAIVYEGIDLHLLAKQMGTSIAMIEKHYSHLTPRMNAHKLAGSFRQRMMEIEKPIPWGEITKEIEEAVY
jgi:integrase